MSRQKRHSFTPEEEMGFKKQYVLWMYKPLLIVVGCVACFLIGLVWTCLFNPTLMAQPEYIPGLLRIHLSMLAFTIVILLLAVAFRREYFEKPSLYLLLNDAYAYAALIWSSTLTAYGSGASIFFSTALVYVALVIAMVVLFKPLKAVLVYSAYFLLYTVLVTAVWPRSTPVTDDIFNAGLASLFGIAICYGYYRFRARTFFDQMTIEKQMHSLNEANDKLRTLIHMDQLTGLYNRRFYEEALPALYEQMRAGEGFLFCLMMDLDYFKKYNDTYGHPAGDVCLIKVAQIVQKSLTVAPSYAVRYGGEEFLVLAAAKTREEAAGQAEEICRAVAASYLEHKSHPLKKVTVSIGMSVLPSGKGAVDLAEMVKKADDALYLAKEQGRNRVVELGMET